MKNKRYFLRMSLITVTLFLLYGCQSQVQIPTPPTKSFTVNVVIDSAYKDESITIDLLSLDRTSLMKYKSFPWINYYQDRESLKDLRCTIPHKKGDPDILYTLPSNDPLWKTWAIRNTEYLLVFSDFNKMAGRPPLVIPLQRNCWRKGLFYTKTITITLDGRGISYSPMHSCMCTECQ